MTGHDFEVLVRRQQAQSVPDAQPGQEGVDRADLNPASAAVVPQSRGFDVILDLWRNDGEEREFFHDPLCLGRSLESLEQFLEHDSRAHDHVAALQALVEKNHLGRTWSRSAPERQRPNARVHEKVHDRDRSAL